MWALGAILPDAPNAPAFWQNICNKRYSIIEVPPERWSIADYYDPDPTAPDKSYSKIGSWVRGFEFDWKRFRIPPKVAAAMDESQQWAVTIAAEALADYGYPGARSTLSAPASSWAPPWAANSTTSRTRASPSPNLPTLCKTLPSFSSLPEPVRQAILEQWQRRMDEHAPGSPKIPCPANWPISSPAAWLMS